MKHRFDYLTILKNFNALLKTQHFTTIETFRYDLAGEYTSNDFTTLLASNGIIHQTTCTNTPKKMAMLKENIVILLRLQDHSCYLLMYQVPFGGELFL